ASRERSTAHSSAAGTVNSAVLSTSSSSVEGDSRIRVVTLAEKSTAHRQPARLGSSARRRGREAERQRTAITTTTASDATARKGNWILVSHVEKAPLRH